MASMGDMPDVPRNVMSISPCHVEGNSPFGPRKTNYRPDSGGTNCNFPCHIRYFPWPDPIKINPSTIICPLTTRLQPQSSILRVHLQREEAGLIEKSDIMVDQLRAIDNRRFIKKLGAIGRSTQKRLTENIQMILT